MKIRNNFSLFMGLRNFYSFRKGRKRTMAGAAVASALAIIPLIVVLHVSDGMIEGITRRFIELETGHIQVIAHDEYTIDELDQMSLKLSAIPEINSAIPMYKGTALIYSSAYKSGIQVKAMPEDIISRDPGFAKYLEVTGGAFDITEGKIMLSSELASILETGVGEKIKMLTAKTTASGRMILRPEPFVITGIFSTGYHEIDSLTAYIGLEKGQKLFSGPGSLILCKIDDPYRMADKAAGIINMQVDAGFSVVTWYRLQSAMYESLYTTRVLLVFIMALIVVVASVNITSSMIIMVIERKQDIAILKSCGARRNQIKRAFIFTGLMTGIAGSAAGIILGLLISVNVNSIIKFFQAVSGVFTAVFTGVGEVSSVVSATAYYLEEIPVKIKPIQLMAVGVSAVILSTAAALFPAAKAEKMMPGEIIQKH